jgi:protease-4
MLVTLGRGVRLLAMAVGFATLGMFALAVLFIALGSFEPAVPQGSTLVVRPGGALPEHARDDLVARLGADAGGTVRSLVASLDKASRDPRVVGLLLRPSGLVTPYWAGVQELREAVLRFRETGKSVTAFLEYGGEREYFLATAADRVLLVPTSPLDLTGVASYEIFLGNFLEAIGAEPDFLSVGAYKTAPNQFTEAGFTPEHREALEAFTKDVYDQLVAAVASARGKSEAEVRTLIDQGPFGPEEALAAGLVDELAYVDEFGDDGGGAPRARLFSESAYRSVSARGAGLRPRARVAVLNVVGVIASGRSRVDAVNGVVVGSESVAADIRRIRDDASIDAMVIRIVSPGGSAVASDVIWRELKVARERRPELPLVVSMGDVAASGGYYIATAADTIVAQPGTLTGSIGVYAGKVAIGGVLERFGVGTDAVVVGRNAGIDSPFEPFSPGQRARLDAYVQTFYQTFVGRVADARRATPEAIDAVAQGRVWSGAAALDHGLVDRLGGLDVAVALAKADAGVPAGDDVELVMFPERRTLYEALTEQLGGTVGSASLFDVLGLGIERGALDALTAPTRLFRRGEPLALLPFALVQ